MEKEFASFVGRKASKLFVAYLYVSFSLAFVLLFRTHCTLMNFTLSPAHLRTSARALVPYLSSYRSILELRSATTASELGRFACLKSATAAINLTLQTDVQIYLGPVSRLLIVPTMRGFCTKACNVMWNHNCNPVVTLLLVPTFASGFRTPLLSPRQARSQSLFFSGPHFDARSLLNYCFHPKPNHRAAPVEQS